MSRLSRVCILIIWVGLAFIASLRLYRAYEQKVQDQAERSADGFSASSFLRTSPPVVELPVFQPLPKNGADVPAEIFLEDAPLPASARKEQARQTIASILEDYREDPKLQAFHADLQKAAGRPLNLTDLSGEQLPDLLRSYPQIQPVIAQYSQDPQFAKLLQEIFSNPQFVRSVGVLQQPGRKK